ncbi:hypothetical protein HOR96_gp10 [Agrobacterium phage Atu_ph02]|uniref:dATP/dGTP diphosphohydrolase N-terminal domain-containing protein n=1 Tax=Agrobacterium phage Atu_ph02 TaxID=2024261 RepID=A0A223VZG8_9CAUD|nr:hypothetical protein HOR96_gp10 [Agrobacterium phage Atu_ph02]ASV44560.1 hypothetical protein [Agrobacterium phage Atu_ph02]
MTSGKDRQAKADGGKGDPTLLQRDFAPALYLVQRALDYGLIKYERGSWRKVEHERWDAAQRRHQQKLDMFEGKDDESDLPHRAHQIAGLIIMFQLEVEKAAKEMGKSVLEVATILGEFKPPPQDHKAVHEAVDAAIPKMKTSGRKRWTNVRDAEVGDWVRAKSNYRSPVHEKHILFSGKEYKVLATGPWSIMAKDERGTRVWFDKAYFY